MPDDCHDHPHGLAHDLARLAEIAQRRRALRALAGWGAVAGAPTLLATGASAQAACTVIPSETAGPFPGNGNHGGGIFGRLFGGPGGSGREGAGPINVLTQSGIVRSDVRDSFGGLTGKAGGARLALTLQLVNTAASCAPLGGYAVYIWHCDSAGLYSLYNTPAQNYLRGVQVTDSVGNVGFTTTFPGCYEGRWPHIHFEVYRSLGTATAGRNALKTSQLALPAAACHEVYQGLPGYQASVRNLASVTLANDFEFRDDGAVHQLAATRGSIRDAAGFSAKLVVGIAA